MSSLIDPTRSVSFSLLAAALLAAGGPAAAAARPSKPAAAKKAVAKQAVAKKAAAPAPAAAPIVSLSVTPANITLDGPKSREQLLVTGTRKDGSQCDLTARAQYFSKSPRVLTVSADGVARPAGNGVGTVLVKAAGRSTTAKLTAKNVDKPFVWSFRNHVISVLSKEGCSMGACHGAAAGKNGFRLTLRGYDPDLDYDRLLHESGGRRIQRADPGNSLLLKKATLTVPHAGGMRFKPNSLEYRVIAEWIAAGMPAPTDKDPKLTGLEVMPSQRTLTPNDRQQLVVLAHFDDGHTEDVTHWARYSSNEEAIATVDDEGKISTKGVGETSITVMYLNLVSRATVSVPFPNKISPAQYARFKPNNYIDQQVLAKLKNLRIAPSPLSSDEEFFRRVYLDCIGTLPSAEDTKAFLQDKSPDKRRKLVDQLLERPEWIDFWTYKWGDLLRVNRETLTEKGMWSFYSWLREQVAQDRPWDQLVKEVLEANGSNFSYGPSNFYRISRTPEDLTETVSQAFLGIRVQCARCHNHPFEKWTQQDYYKFANLFSRVNRKTGDHPQDQIITVKDSGDIAFPKTGKPLPPTPYDGKPMPLDSKEDRRVYLADWLASPQNPYFVRSIVNRVWRHFMGRGLIEPVDDLRLTNPASNEPLMDALSKDLTAHHFDLKYLMRQIMNSRTYQLTSRPLPENKKDDRQYSRYFVRRLTAEQLLDAICQVTDQPEKFNGLPMGYRAIQLPDTRVANYFLDVFGRPPRQITCDCERAQEPNMAQALHLINGQGVNQKISSDSGYVARLLKSGKKENEIVEEMYLTCFGRYPTKQETDTALEMVDEAVHPKPAEEKPADAKPADPKAVNAKAAPTDAKAAAKPADAKPASKAADARNPADPKAVKAAKAAKTAKAVKAAKAANKPVAKTAPGKPADPKAAAKPADPKAAKPADAKPAEAKADTKPAGPKAAEAKKPEAPKIDPAVARRQVFEDLLWALINGKEFVFNH